MYESQLVVHSHIGQTMVTVSKRLTGRGVGRRCGSLWSQQERERGWVV